MKRIATVLLALIWWGTNVNGQGFFTDSVRAARAQYDPQELANPSVLGMGKSRGVIVRYESQPRFGLRSQGKSEGIGDSEVKVLRGNLFEFKAYAPVWNRPHLKVVVGGGYQLEEFNFKDPKVIEYPLYKTLEDKDLRSLTGQLLLLRPINAKNYFLVRVKGELNGDYGKYSNISFSKYLKTSMEAIYGWKKSPYLSYGVGVQLGYNFGRQTIYPAFIYNRTFNDRWGVESIFPANVTFRRNFSEKSLFYMGYKIEGASYSITMEDDPALSKFETIELRKSEIRARFRWDREIYDFIWFGLETGYRYTHKFDVYDGDNRKANPLITNHIKDAIFFDVELFLVPPRRFLKQ
ncbi:MAG: DUF6268 family outer membrane beta-barrel protein [Rufibacter sp.]